MNIIKLITESIEDDLRNPNVRTRASVFMDPLGHSVKGPTSDHVEVGLRDADGLVRMAAIQHPNATPEQISKALYDTDPYVRRYAVSHSKATAEHIDAGIKDIDPFVRLGVFHRNELKNMTREHIEKGITDPDKHVRDRAYRLYFSHIKNIDHDDITKAMEPYNSPYYAITHPKATAEHISRALDSDQTEQVRQRALSHPNVTEQHITKAQNDSHLTVRELAVKHKKATTEHITRAMNDHSWTVRKAAVKNKKATAEHVLQGLMDDHVLVRTTAASKDLNKLGIRFTIEKQ